MKFLFKFLLIVFCIFYSSKIKADFLTLDSHIDIPFDYMSNPEHDPGNKTDMQVDFQKMLEGNLDGGFFIVYVGQSELDKNGFQAAKKKAIIKFNAIKKMVEKYPERIVLVKNPSEVYQAKREKKLFAAIGIDIEFTRHFHDRVNDPRNKKPITTAELIGIFRRTYKRHGKRIRKFSPGAEAVIKDMRADINMPFVINIDRNGMLDLVAKTVMRKRDFKTTSMELPVWKHSTNFPMTLIRLMLEKQ